VIERREDKFYIERLRGECALTTGRRGRGGREEWSGVLLSMLKEKSLSKEEKWASGR